MAGRRSITETLQAVFRSWGGLEVADQAPHRAGYALRLSLRRPDGTFLPVGELSQDGDSFVFRYLPEYIATDGTQPLRAFRSFNREYRSSVLWPFFSVRLPSRKRPEVRAILEEHDVDEADVLRVLGTLARRTITSPYELEEIDATSGHAA